MDEKRIVFGKGFLGTRISEELGYKLVGQNELDPSDFQKLENYLDSEKPEVVINAVVKIGKPNSDWCEDNHGVTLESNVLVPSNLAITCERRNIFFTHMSSGCIYNGDNDGKGFTETDIPNNYGNSFHLITKILAEKILEKKPCLIVRLKMPLDIKPHPRNLITKLIKYDQVIDEQNSLTFVPHLISTMKRLIDKRATGTYNVFNEGTFSASEIMNLYREIVDPSHSFEVIDMGKLGELTKATRANSYLNTDKLKAEGIYLPRISEATKECLEKYAQFSKEEGKELSQ